MNLSGNQIGPEGAQYLAQVLESNTVGISSLANLSYSDDEMKTLKVLDLSNNRCGNMGARHMAHALRRNTVGRIFLLTIHSLLFNIGIENFRPFPKSN